MPPCVPVQVARIVKEMDGLYRIITSDKRWSEWQNYGYCECEPYTQTGIIMQKRRCNNPAPVYGDRMRTTPSGEDAMEESTVEICDCPNIVTTTTTEKPERLWMCCCEKERLDGSSQPEPVTKGTVFGRGRRQSEDSPDYFLDCITDKKDTNCCKSLEESTAAEKPEESQQKIYDNY
ncbi:uncharacterized protein LOC127865046 [Dreissena polymorpha]|uniref:uncharacterized protein LOC127865046 n=1 Tax=Dreissena polymorpha TaxID=45954 RepID=UPI00226466EF|nr:uncharacterized protein LOC127865046 [Dreissena polymorpha]